MLGRRFTRKPEGWHKGTSGGKPINNVDLPDQLLLRWQSLVEPQAYKISIRIPQWVRDERSNQKDLPLGCE
jgi:hypothetical protein